VWEEYPDGELEEALISRVIRDVVKSCRGMGDGVVAKVDEEELRARCGAGKVFFMPKGRDLGVFEVRAYRFALVRLSEEVEVGVDKKGNGKVFSKLDIGNGVRKATVYRQFLVEEEANICMDMMETRTGDVDNLIVGVRGFVRADEYDEYIRRNAVRMFGRMGMKVFGLMTLVSKVDLKVELIMLVISMGRIGGSQLRTAFGWKKGTSFSKVGGLVGGLSVELVLHYDQVGRGKDVRQDGPVIELEGEGAMDLGMDGVTTVLSPYGDLGVLGMARCILSVSAGAAKWKVFVKPTEWEKLSKLEGKGAGGMGVAVRVKFNAWSKGRAGAGKYDRHLWEKDNCGVICWDGAAVSWKVATMPPRGGGGGGGEGPKFEQDEVRTSSGTRTNKLTHATGINLTETFNEVDREGH
jgi:hypothetical protein